MAEQPTNRPAAKRQELSARYRQVKCNQLLPEKRQGNIGVCCAQNGLKSLIEEKRMGDWMMGSIQPLAKMAIPVTSSGPVRVATAST